MCLFPDVYCEILDTVGSLRICILEAVAMLEPAKHLDFVYWTPQIVQIASRLKTRSQIDRWESTPSV